MNKRRFIQILSTILHNGYINSIFTYNIYTGFLKKFCAPGLNCHSCPASFFGCPLGILQNFLISIRILSLQVFLGALFYITGFFFLFGFALGRFICGWLCPFGFLQDLIYKIPFFKKIIILPFQIQRYFKYIILIIFIFIIPLFVITNLGYGILGFCKYLCPAGTLEGGYLNLLLHKNLRTLVGNIFYLKSLILVSIFLLCIIDLRFFCKNLCPLGLIYGFFNRFCFLKLSFNPDRCTSCKICENICPSNLSIPDQLNSVDCFRCLNCMQICPTQAINLNIGKINELSCNKIK